MSVEVSIAYDLAEQLLSQIEERLGPAIEQLAKEVPTIIKEKAILDNEDVDGHQMSSKQPRPQNDPENFPNVALIQNDKPDEMDPARWTFEQVSPTEWAVIYSPSAHHKWLITKDPDKGGRKWILPERINPNARAEIERRLREIAEP